MGGNLSFTTCNYAPGHVHQFSTWIMLIIIRKYNRVLYDKLHHTPYNYDGYNIIKITKEIKKKYLS